MDQNSQNYKEVEIDLCQHMRVIVKRKKTFIAVFLLIFVTGVINILISPRTYSASMMIQPPVIGPSLTGANDLESAENLKGLIINGVYNEKLKKILDLDLKKSNLGFKVVIPSKTNILQISVDLDSKSKDSGVTILKDLADVISVSYDKCINASIVDITNQIESIERAIVSAKEKAKNLKEQIRETAIREDQLREEIKNVNENTAQILAKREGLLRNNVPTENVSILLLTNFIQNNSSYSNQLNNQLSDLFIRKVNLDIELKNTDPQISDFQVGIDKLNIKKSFISNLKIIAQPVVSPNPIGLNKKKALVISIVMGLFFGMLVVFLQEFLVNNLVKK